MGQGVDVLKTSDLYSTELCFFQWSTSVFSVVGAAVHFSSNLVYLHFYFKNLSNISKYCQYRAVLFIEYRFMYHKMLISEHAWNIQFSKTGWMYEFTLY